MVRSGSLPRDHSSLVMLLPNTKAQPLPSADLGDVGLGGQADHNVQLLQLHVDGVIVLHEENLHLVLQDLWPGCRAGLTEEQKARYKPYEKNPSTFAVSYLGSDMEPNIREGSHCRGYTLPGRGPSNQPKQGSDWPLCVQPQPRKGRRNMSKRQFIFEGQQVPGHRCGNQTDLGSSPSL